MNIYQRINAVMQKVAYVQKDKRVQDYMAVTHDNVTSVVRPYFVEFGIAVVPVMVASKTETTGTTTSKGTPILRYEATYEVAFVNMDEPTDRIVVRLDAHGNDTGDKAPGKALSYATKYAILKVLLLETGENDEARAVKDRQDEELTEAQETKLQSLRDAALNGIKALEIAWTVLTKDDRRALQFQLDSLKKAAHDAEKVPA